MPNNPADMVSLRHVVISLEPGERGSGIVFVNKIVGGAIPKEYHLCCSKRCDGSR